MPLGKGAEAVGETLVFLDRYARMHFSTEEGYMGSTHYPGYGSTAASTRSWRTTRRKSESGLKREGPGCI